MLRRRVTRRRASPPPRPAKPPLRRLLRAWNGIVAARPHRTVGFLTLLPRIIVMSKW